MTSLATHLRTGQPFQGGSADPTLNRVLRLLTSPHEQPPEVAAAVQVLLDAAGATGVQSIQSKPTTSEFTGRFKRLTDLLGGVIGELAAPPDNIAIFDDQAPEYVPAEWHRFLHARAIEDPDLVMPWLDELND